MVIQQVRENGVDFLILRYEEDFFSSIARLLKDQDFKIFKNPVGWMQLEQSN